LTRTPAKIGASSNPPEKNAVLRALTNSAKTPTNAAAIIAMSSAVAIRQVNRIDRTAGGAREHAENENAGVGKIDLGIGDEQCVACSIFVLCQRCETIVYAGV
jgi:hypothetical protein